MLVPFYPEDETLIWLALSRIPGLGRRMITTLLECFEGPQSILEATEAQLASFSKMTPDLLNAIRAVDFTTVKSELDSLTAGDIRLVHWRHPDYPANLQHSPDGPIVLRIKGQLAVEDRNAVAIVGTTSPTSEARALARLLGEKLATEGLTIVSGLAKGIDSEAHRGALEAAGRTLGILGCGLDRIFPPENRGLAAEVVESGALLSEMPLGVPATGRRLMARNPRLIATYPTKGPAVAISEGVDRDRAVDESGNQISVFSRVGSRPFNLSEMQRMYLRAGKVYTVTNSAPSDALKFEIKEEKKEKKKRPRRKRRK